MNKKVFDAKQYTIAAFDVDGTLIPPRGKLSPGVRQALLALRRSGVMTVLTTGRDELQVAPDLMQCFTYAVTANGGCVSEVSSRRLVAGHPFSKELLLETIRTLEGLTGGCILFRRGSMPGEPKALKVMLDHYPPGSRHFLMPKSGPEPGRPFAFPWIRALAWYSPFPVYKIKCYFRQEAGLHKAFELLRRDGRLNTILVDGDDLEITLAGISKGSALEELCAHLGCGMEHVAAFGDSINDLEMLQQAGFAVVMGNGEDCVMPLADYVAPGVSEDGAATAIYDLYGLRGEE